MARTTEIHLNPPVPAEKTPTDLVLVEQGTLPIILTAPRQRG